METNLLMARRSIYNHKKDSIAYQLLFQKQDAAPNETEIVPTELTIEYLAQLLEDESIQKIVGNKQVWIPFSMQLLQQDLSKLPKEKFLIVLDQRQILPDQSLVDVAKKLSEEKFSLALQGYTEPSAIQNLLPFVSIIGIDVENIHSEQLPKLYEAFSANGAQILAGNVQTHDTFEKCLKMGFKLFEGYFLNLPNLVNSQKISSNHLTTMRLLTALDDDEITLDKVEELLSQDARLSYRLLRAVNSAAFGFRKKINSLREAIIYLGLKQIRSWANIIILSGLDEKPSDLLLTSMARAKMCELIAEYIGAEDPKPFFTVGLFSTLDAMLDKKMEDIVEELSLSERLKEALLNRDGDIGAVLSNVIAYSKAEWEELRNSGIEMEIWRQAYLESLQWSNVSYGEITEARKA